MTTHYLRYDDSGWTSRYARSVCGRLIEPAKDFSNTPSCPKCAAWVRGYEAITDEDMFGPLTPPEQIKDV